MKKPLRENLEYGDLARLVHNELHIDEFKSKLGEDQDIVVISFKVQGKEPGLDMVSFLEKGFDWVVDADVSSGEMHDGDYIVFIEAQRSPDIPEKIMAMMKNMINLTKQDLSDWRVKYYRNQTEYPLSLEILKKIVPGTSEEYKEKFPDDKDDDDDEQLDKLRTAAGLKSKKKAPDNELTRKLKVAAGIL